MWLFNIDFTIAYPSNSSTVVTTLFFKFSSSFLEARLKSSENNQLKHGVALFSLKTKSPIVPAYFVKKTNAFTFNTLLVGKPIELYNMEEFKDKKIDREVLEQASKIVKKEMNTLYKNYLKEKEDKKKKKLEKKLKKQNKKSNLKQK